MDANFGLTNLRKNCDPTDKSLLEGQGYFVKEGPFLEYVKEHENDKEEVSMISLPDMLALTIFFYRKVLVLISMPCRRKTV